jgi:hypothetical protein
LLGTQEAHWKLLELLEQWWHVGLTHHCHWWRVVTHAVTFEKENLVDQEKSFLLFLLVLVMHPTFNCKTKKNHTTRSIELFVRFVLIG